jgi:hypothetical protein
MPHEPGHTIDGPPSVPDWRWPSNVPTIPSYTSSGVGSMEQFTPDATPPGIPTGGGGKPVVLPKMGSVPNPIRSDQLWLLQRLGFDTAGVLTQEDFQRVMNQSFGPGGTVQGQAQPVSQSSIAKLIGGEVAAEQQQSSPMEQFSLFLQQLFGDESANNLLGQLFNHPGLQQVIPGLPKTTFAR